MVKIKNANRNYLQELKEEREREEQEIKEMHKFYNLSTKN